MEHLRGKMILLFSKKKIEVAKRINRYIKELNDMVSKSIIIKTGRGKITRYTLIE